MPFIVLATPFSQTLPSNQIFMGFGVFLHECCGTRSGVIGNIVMIFFMFDGGGFASVLC